MRGANGAPVGAPFAARFDFEFNVSEAGEKQTRGADFIVGRMSKGRASHWEIYLWHAMCSMQFDVKLQFLVLTIAAFAQSGCHSNLYVTPRTVPTGKSTHTVALDVPAYRPIPTLLYMARIGLADRVDIGIRAGGDLKVDLKVNVLRSKYLDLAINPMGGLSSHTFISIEDSLVWTFGVPFIVGLNLSSGATLMLQGGPMLQRYKGYYINDGVMIHPVVGAGMQFRVSDWVSIQPEVSLNFLEFDAPPWPCIGIGLGFGPQPRYD